MNNYDAYKAGQQYGQQNPQAQVPTSSQMPNYDQRIAFSNGMKDAQNK
jgi:hypothetical protein|tara:strand:- start:245 stop:388 length:144 start_codon:yes stop_codon:yes gene_type:complete